MANIQKHLDALAYGVRAGISVPMVYACYRFFHLPHGYWAPMSACLVLQLQAGFTFQRSYKRTIGHTLGAILLAPLGLLWFVFPLPMFWLPLIFLMLLFCFPFRYMIFSMLLIVLVSAMYAFVPPYYMKNFDVFSFGVQRLFDVLLGIIIPVGVTLILFPKTSSDEFIEGAALARKDIVNYIKALTLQHAAVDDLYFKNLYKRIHKQLQINQEKLNLVRYETFNPVRYKKLNKEFYLHEQALISLHEVDKAIPKDTLTIEEKKVQEELNNRLNTLANDYENNVQSYSKENLFNLDQHLTMMSDLASKNLLDFHRYAYYIAILNLIDNLEKNLLGENN